MADLLERLKQALADRYAIDHEIGRGGMATVYLAEDLKHRRKVAPAPTRSAETLEVRHKHHSGLNRISPSRAIARCGGCWVARMCRSALHVPPPAPVADRNRPLPTVRVASHTSPASAGPLDGGISGRHTWQRGKQSPIPTPSVMRDILGTDEIRSHIGGGEA
jgi:hypothetical protein